MQKVTGLVAVAALGLANPTYAAPSSDAQAQLDAGHPKTAVELIAFEAPGCTYCAVFRRDVMPNYATSLAGKQAPLRFVDVNDEDAERLELTRPITIVPTVVVVREGREIGRIDGYVGPINFHRMIDTMLGLE